MPVVETVSDDYEGIDLSLEEVAPEDGESVEVEASAAVEDPGTFDHIAPPDRKLITQPYDLAVGDLVNQVGDDRLHLRPVYQRQYVWDNKKASKLVESLLINVPIPVCYLTEESDGSRSVIDGQQRLRSLYRFLDNQFPLRGLEVLPELNKKRFHQLTERQQRLISNRTIRCIVISEESDPDIRFDVFERLNTGSVALNAQELRNSVYRGKFNDLLRELARSPEFSQCLAGRSDSRMTFEELALRFLALDQRLEQYRPSLKRFLNDFMRDSRRLEEDQLDVMRARFLDAATKAHAVFGGNCFRRATGTPEEWNYTQQINSAVFDVVMLNFGRLDVSAEDLAANAEKIEMTLVALMLENDDFGDAISLATGDRVRLFRRVRMYARALQGLGVDTGLSELQD